MLLTPGKPVYFSGGACEIKLPEYGKLLVIPSLLAENLALVSLLGWPKAVFSLLCRQISLPPSLLRPSCPACEACHAIA